MIYYDTVCGNPVPVVLDITDAEIEEPKKGMSPGAVAGLVIFLIFALVLLALGLSAFIMATCGLGATTVGGTVATGVIVRKLTMKKSTRVEVESALEESEES